MPAIVRRTSTKVVNGQVTRKNRTNWSSVDGYFIRNYPAGRGYRHVVSPKQLSEFLEIIPDSNGSKAGLFWLLHVLSACQRFP